MWDEVSVARRKQLPEPEILQALRAEGRTYADIGAAYGVGGQAVYLSLKNADKATVVQYRHTETLPWPIEERHRHTHPAVMLRALGRRTKHLSLTEAMGRRLDTWLAGMDSHRLVVAYHPEALPNHASPRRGGFYYAVREPEDGDSLVRTPQAQELIRAR